MNTRITALFVAALAGAGCGRKTPECGAPIDDPDCAAWSLFAEINRPSPSSGRDVNWETWITAKVLFASSNTPPVWPGGAPQPKQFERSYQFAMVPPDSVGTPGAKSDRLTGPRAIVPSREDIGRFEIRLNRDTFDYIVQRRLWNQSGLQKAYSGPPIDFPPGSIDIKADWARIDEGQKAAYHWQRVPDVNGNPTLLGLRALHMTSRILPNWLWATWKQKWETDATHDRFGFSSSDKMSSGLREMFRRNGLLPEMENYRLIGTQTEFVESDGMPTKLGNSNIEGLTAYRSSCVTCHSAARINPDGCVLRDTNDVCNPLNCFGPPEPDAFKVNRQIHFVWALHEANGPSCPLFPELDAMH